MRSRTAPEAGKHPGHNFILQNNGVTQGGRHMNDNQEKKHVCGKFVDIFGHYSVDFFLVRREFAQPGTFHHSSSRFLAFEAGVKRRSIFEHSAGDVEDTVTDSAESVGMAGTAGFQSKIFGFALLIGPSRIRQVVCGIP
jgi:hypothetical protein